MFKYAPEIAPIYLGNNIRLIDHSKNNWAFQRQSKKFRVWDTLAFVAKTENLPRIAERFLRGRSLRTAQEQMQNLPTKPSK